MILKKTVTEGTGLMSYFAYINPVPLSHSRQTCRVFCF